MPTRDMPLLSPASGAAVVAMIDTEVGRWSAKVSVLGFIAAFEGGAYIRSTECAEWTGLAEGSVRRMLAELEADHVIVRAGDRVKWVTLNPDVFAWVVPWRVEISELVVAGRLQWIEAETAKGAHMRFIARPYVARSLLISARNLLGLLARSSRPIHGLARENPALRAITDQGSREKPPSRALIAAGAPSVVFGGEKRFGVSEGDVGASPPPVALEQWGRCKAALLARAVPIHGRKFLNDAGELADRVRSLIADYGAEAMLDAVATVEPAGVVDLVNELEAVMRFPELADLGADQAEPDDDPRGTFLPGTGWVAPVVPAPMAAGVGQ